MSRNIPLAHVQLGPAKAIVDVPEIYEKTLLPYGAHDVLSIAKWYEGRRIPASRENLKYLFQEFGEDMNGLLEKSLALSLSDMF